MNRMFIICLYFFFPSAVSGQSVGPLVVIPFLSLVNKTYKAASYRTIDNGPFTWISY
jgi:hypothetical protein